MMKIFTTLLIGLLINSIGHTQIEETGLLEENGGICAYKFKYTSNIDDTITIKVIDPRGELMSTPVINKYIVANESVLFDLTNTYWIRGQYQIVVESRKSKYSSKKLYLDHSGRKI